MAMPLGHRSEAQMLRPLARREKRLIWGVSSAVAIALVALLVVTLSQPARRSAHGCISVSLAYAMGGTQTDRCGAAARTMCSAVAGSGLSRAGADEVARACRRAGLPVS